MDAMPIRGGNRCGKGSWWVNNYMKNFVILGIFLANQTGRYFGNQQPPATPVQLTFLVTDFVKRLEQSAAIHRQQQTLLATIPHLPLVYEQDLAYQATWVQTVARICDDLAIPATNAVTSTVQKPWQPAHAELIVNYAELESVYQQDERDLRITTVCQRNCDG